MRTLRSISALFLVLLPVALAAWAKYPLDAPLAAKKSIYTPLLLRLLKSWPPEDVAPGDKAPSPVELLCFDTPKQPDYIGIRQVMKVHAPLEKVAAVIDDIDHYKEI